MKREKKATKQITVRVATDVAELLDEHCWEHRAMKGTVVEQALRALLGGEKVNSREVKARPHHESAVIVKPTRQAAAPVVDTGAALVRVAGGSAGAPQAAADVNGYARDAARIRKENGFAPGYKLTAEQIEINRMHRALKAVDARFQAGEIEEPEKERLQAEQRAAWEPKLAAARGDAGQY